MPQINQIQRGDLLQRLVRGLEIKGERSAALALETTVVPIVVLEDLTKQSEWIGPKERAGSIGVNSGAVAAEKSGVALVNPAGSGIIVALDLIRVSLSTAADVHGAFVDEATLAATYIANSACWWTDPRNPQFTTARQLSGTDPGLLISSPLLRIRVGSANPDPVWTTPAPALIIVPGFGFCVECGTVNQGMTVHFVWREISEP